MESTIASTKYSSDNSRIAIAEFYFERGTYPSVESIKLMREFESVDIIRFPGASKINNEILAEIAQIQSLRELHLECGKTYLPRNVPDDSTITVDGLNVLSQLKHLTFLSVSNVNPSGRLKRDAFGILPLEHLFIWTRRKSLNDDDLGVISSMPIKSLGLDGIDNFRWFSSTIDRMRKLQSIELLLDSTESWNTFVKEECDLPSIHVSLFLSRLDFHVKCSLDRFSLKDRKYKRITLWCTNYPESLFDHLDSDCYEFMPPSHRFTDNAPAQLTAGGHKTTKMIGCHDNPFGIRLSALMIAKRIPDTSVPMSLLADHPNVRFSYLVPAIGTCDIEMH